MEDQDQFHSAVKVELFEHGCDYCKLLTHTLKAAVVDGKTKDGPWAYMCEEHFRDFGVGLGLGKGQRLVST